MTLVPFNHVPVVSAVSNYVTMVTSRLEIPFPSVTDEDSDLVGESVNFEIFLIIFVILDKTSNLGI